MTQTQTPAQSRDSTQTAADTAKDLKNEARETAQNLKDRATEEAARRGDAAKQGLAEEVSQIGSALRHAADELREGSPQERTFGYMADALADVSDTVRNKDLGQLAGDVSDFARRNPVAFLGGAALLGFAATRVARASERNKGNSVDLAHLWDSDEGDDHLEAEVLNRPGSRNAATPAGAASGAPSAATPSTQAGRPGTTTGEF